MNKTIKAVSFILLLCISFAMLFACKAENWLSPMLNVVVQDSELGVYDDFELAKLNLEGATADELMTSNAVTKATLRLSYKGKESHKVRINVRVDEIETEPDGSIGHNIIGFNVSKTRVSILHYADETWFDGAYGSSIATGGDTLFDERYYAEGEPEYSSTRRAIALNKETAKDIGIIDFYIVGQVSGYYVLNFYIEAADTHGHFHGINKLALSTAVVSVKAGGQ